VNDPQRSDVDQVDTGHHLEPFAEDCVPSPLGNSSDEPATGRSSLGAALADATSSVSMATATAAARQAPPANVKNRGMTQPDWVW
jgi:hypothetical protein